MGDMSFKTIVNNSRVWLAHHSAGAGDRLARRTDAAVAWGRRQMLARPLAAAGLLLAVGLVAGAGIRSAADLGQVAWLQAKTDRQQAQLEQVRRGAQHEINAMAARLAELQAQANRLNALGERLTRIGQLEDGEFDFDKPVGIGGGESESYDMPPAELSGGLDQLQRQFDASGRQLSVLETLLFNRQQDSNAMPSGAPIDSYITSGYGGRADPFGGGGQFHKGIDFKASVGDPVRVVADGVVSFAGVKSGYGNVVDVDHGNGYVTRYAHNSRLVVKEGDLVRVGDEVAKAGSTGRSTGAHVHFEVWVNGSVVNPRKFLGKGPTPVGRG